MDYDTLASPEVVAKTAEALGKNGIEAIVVATRAEALAKIQELIPAGATVMNGASRTLEEVGFAEYLKSGKHEWNDLQAAVQAEQDSLRRAALRKQAVHSDYYLGSVHAIAETGQLVIASNSGSQLPHIVFTSPNIIFVAGTQKIEPNLDTALSRLEEYVFPLEDARMKSVGVAAGSFISKLLIVNREPSFSGRKVRMILVNEKLGF